MSNNKTKRTNFFLYFFFLLLFLPLIQVTVSPFKLVGLKGAIKLTTIPQFTIASFFNTTYQDSAANYLKHNFPFKGDLVRFHNQIDYSLFKKINTVFTLGKQNYIFDYAYVNSITGKDLLSDKDLQQKNNSFLNAVSILKKLNIPIIVCFVPNKANFYLEYLVEPVTMATKTNHYFFEKMLLDNNIPFINFDRKFKLMKKDAAYPLIPKYGAHWSSYGSYFGALALFEKLDEVTKKRHVELNLNQLVLSEKSKFTDGDYLATLNLIVKWKQEPLAYPQLSFIIHKKPNLLFISDSFIWNFYDLNIIENCLDNQSEVWYYNKSKFNINRKQIGFNANEIALDDIKNKDAIILLTSDPGMQNFGFGIFEQIEKLN